MNDELLPYAERCLQQLKSKKIRATVDAQSAKLGAKIRRAETDKVPHMIVVGKREAEEGKISLRSRSNPELDGPHTIEATVQLIAEEISSKTLPKSRKDSH